MAPVSVIFDTNVEGRRMRISGEREMGSIFRVVPNTERSRLFIEDGGGRWWSANGSKCNGAKREARNA